MTRRDLLKAIGWSAVATPTTWSQTLPAGPKKPNILFILADDLGINGVSCYSGTVGAFAGSQIKRETRRINNLFIRDSGNHNNQVNLT